jgi:hypothetical protein
MQSNDNCDGIGIWDLVGERGMRFSERCWRNLANAAMNSRGLTMTMTIIGGCIGTLRKVKGMFVSIPVRT